MPCLRASTVLLWEVCPQLLAQLLAICLREVHDTRTRVVCSLQFIRLVCIPQTSVILDSPRKISLFNFGNFVTKNLISKYKICMFQNNLTGGKLHQFFQKQILSRSKLLYKSNQLVNVGRFALFILPRV